MNADRGSFSQDGGPLFVGRTGTFFAKAGDAEVVGLLQVTEAGQPVHKDEDRVFALFACSNTSIDFGSDAANGIGSGAWTNDAGLRIEWRNGRLPEPG